MRRRAARRRQGGNAAARRARPAPGCGKVAPSRRVRGCAGRGAHSAGAPTVLGHRWVAAPRSPSGAPAVSARWSEPGRFASRCSPVSTRRSPSPSAAIPPPPQRCPLASAQFGPVPARGNAGACPPRLPLSVTSPVRKPRGAGAARRRAPECWRRSSEELSASRPAEAPRRGGHGAAPLAGAAARPGPARRGRCIYRNGGASRPAGVPRPEAAAAPVTLCRGQAPASSEGTPGSAQVEGEARGHLGGLAACLSSVAVGECFEN